MKRWFVVNTKPKNEGRAATNLAGGGFEVLSPRLRARKLKEGKFIDVVEPMFPSYVFVRFDPVNEYHTIKFTRGVKTVVNFNGTLVPLEDEVVDFIKGRLVDGIGTVDQKGFVRGEKVLITAGPFKGLSGIFEQELPGYERVAILLEGINFYAKMEIDKGFLAGTGGKPKQ